MQSLLSTMNVGYLVDFCITLDSNAFISWRCLFSKTDVDFNILVLFFLSLIRTWRTSIFECPTGKDNILLIASCAETLLLVKNILLVLSLPRPLWCPFYKFTHCILRLLLISQGFCWYNNRDFFPTHPHALSSFCYNSILV